MLDEKNKAACTAAPKNIRQNRSYCNSATLSKVKLQIGTLLLALQTPLTLKEEKICWTLFDLKLRRYVELKCAGGQL
jgi:hypothetical protein